MKTKLTLFALALLALIVFSVAFAPRLGVTNFESLHLSDSGPTAQPVLRVNQLGAGKLVEFLDGGTPVFSINNGGGIVASTILTQGATINGLLVSLPTAATTATPAAIIDSAAAGSNLLSVRKNATPVFVIGNAGAVTGQVLQYATAGQRQFCASSTITDTASYTVSTSAVATPVFAWCSMSTITGDAATCAASQATGAVTVIVRNSNATPAANAAGALVYWCVIGTP